MEKIILKIIVILVILFLAAHFLLPQKEDPILSISSNDSHLNISIRYKEKEFLKQMAAKIKAIVYREAKENNPPGDLLPDDLDDKIINTIKEKIN